MKKYFCLNFLAGVIFLILNCFNVYANDLERNANSLKLWYLQPAEAWTEALPIGNGRLGAMVFGKVQNERIQINEETLWTGGPHDYNNYSAINNLSIARNLIFNDSLQKATDLIENKMLGNPKFLQAYQPFCDLNIEPTPKSRKGNL